MDNVESKFEQLAELPDEVLSNLTFSMPWQYDPDSSSSYKDPDGFDDLLALSREDSTYTRQLLQTTCWDKFNRNPQVNTSVRGLVGRLTGWGFETSSGNQEIQRIIEDTELDFRNRLYTFWPKYIGRAQVEGELFLLLTVHKDGFVEIDFIDPSTLNGGGDGDSGIIFHPKKTTLPLFYIMETGGYKIQIPSIYVARDPSLVSAVSSHLDFVKAQQKDSISRAKVYKPIGGYYRFVVAWDKGLITHRAVSHLRTVIEWCNHYENLKKYEIDHKKSSGSYL